MFFVTPPYREVVGETWKDRWFERLESVSPAIETWLGHQRRDDYWRHGSVGEDIDASSAPSSSSVDGRTVNATRRCGCSRRIRADRAVIGPWGHVAERQRPAGRGPFDTEVRWWRGGSTTTATRSTTQSLPAYIQDSRRPTQHLLHRPGRWLSCEARALEAETITFTPTSRQAGETSAVARHPSQGMPARVWCPKELPTTSHSISVTKTVLGPHRLGLADDLALLGRRSLISSFGSTSRCR